MSVLSERFSKRFKLLKRSHFCWKKMLKNEKLLKRPYKHLKSFCIVTFQKFKVEVPIKID